MAGSNNFLQWNPNALNQETDGEYLTETQRTNGAVSGLFPSKTANKLFFQCTTMVAAMGEMMKNKGFVISDAVFADLITALTHILTDAQFGSTAGTVCQGNDPRLDRIFISGMRMWFGQNTAPTGWTIDATAADGLLAVKGGSAAYNTTGGSRAGTWTQPNHNHPTGDHSLIIAELPSHYHTYTYGAPQVLAIGGGSTYYAVSLQAGTATSSVGSGTPHNHGNTGNSATANTWRPLANVGIVCIKDA